MAQVSSLYIAGFEAVSNVLAFALYHLARHPEHQATLYDEIQTHLKGKEVTVDLINEMSFLDCIIFESLRLHPPLPIVDRIATRDYEVINAIL